MASGLASTEHVRVAESSPAVAGPESDDEAVTLGGTKTLIF